MAVALQTLFPSSRFWILPLVWGALISGCATPGPTPLAYSVRRVADGEVADLLRHAQAALDANGFPVASVDQAQGVVVSEPVRVEDDEAAEPSWRERRPIRSVATVRVSRGDSGLSVFCKVEIQRQATETYRFFQQERMRSDVPDETAIDRDAATTTEQNTVWETLRRDKAAERQILEAVLETSG